MRKEPINYEGPLPQDVVSRVSDFLKDPVTTDGDWPVVTDPVWLELHEVVYNIIEAKFQRDCDNDQVIEFAMCNRKRNRMHAITVPYHTRTPEEMEHAMYAIGTASQIIDQLQKNIAYTLGEQRRQAARLLKMKPVTDFLASNGHIVALERVRTFVNGGSLFIGSDASVWDCLGLTTFALVTAHRDNYGNHNLYDIIDQVLIDAVAKTEGNT